MKPAAGGGAAADDRARVACLIEALLLPAFARALNEGGLRPGLSLLHAPCLTSWQILGLAPDERPLATTGSPTPARLACVWYGEAFHQGRRPGDRRHAALAHLSRVMMLPEAPDPDAPVAPAAEPQPVRHDPADMCLMGPGGVRLCGFCLATLMGFDTRAESFNPLPQQDLPI